MPLGRAVDQFFKPRLSERDRMDWAARIYGANARLDDIERHIRNDVQARPDAPDRAFQVGWEPGDGTLRTSSDPLHFDDALDIRAKQMRAVEFARDRVKVLDYAVLDSVNDQTIPEELFFRRTEPGAVAQIRDIVPASLMLQDGNSPVSVVLVGQALLPAEANTIPAVTVYAGSTQGKSAALTDMEVVPQAGGGALAITFKPGGPGVYFFTVTLKKDATHAADVTLVSPPLKLLNPEAPEAGPKP